MSSQIYDFTLTTEFSTKGAGQSRWAFAEKDGHEYFIKELPKPSFPDDSENISKDLLDKKREKCYRFYREKSQFYNELMKCRTGNNIVPIRFFRFEHKYYLVSDRIKKEKIDFSEVAALDEEKKLVLLRSVLYSIMQLHKHGIVHGDIKPDNILLKRTADGYMTAKIIDFDSGFFAAHIPDELQCDYVYLAPETFLRMREEAGEIMGKIDVFALGLVFHQYYTGKLPDFPDDYDYACEAVLNGEKLVLDASIPGNIAPIIDGMLKSDPDERLSSSEAFNLLKSVIPGNEKTVSNNTISSKTGYRRKGGLEED